MALLLRISRGVDALTHAVGGAVAWLLLLAVLVSAGNAFSRKLLSVSSNAWLELQWYLFGAVFLLFAARTLRNGAHVRVDIVFANLPHVARETIDLVGHVVFLLPLCVLMVIHGVPFAADALVGWERSVNPGGLATFPAKLLVPLGFAILLAQTLSEIVKRIATIRSTPPASLSDGGPGAIRFIIVSAAVLFALFAAIAVATLGHSEWLVENMAPVMFGCLIATLLTGYPVAFSLSAVGLAFAVVGIDLDLFTPTFLQALPDRVYGTMANETLLAIPFFTLMGLLLERSRMAEDLLDTIGQLFGPMRGGLAYAVVFVGAILAATTGVVAASVISMGLISLPIMLRYGYNRSVAAGTIAASGTLAQVVPPSLVLIVLADQLGRSVGEMYRAALAPALIIIVLFALYILVLTLLRPKSVPALPAAARTLQGGARSLVVVLALGVIAALAINALAGGLSPAVRQVVAASGGVSVAVAVALLNRVLGLSLLSELAERVVLVLVPPLALIFLVLGTILIGLATPTEGGAMGALATLILAALRGRLPLSTLREAVVSTAQLSTFVLFILIGARVFSLSFYGVDGHLWVEDLLVGLPGGVYGFLIFVSVIIFLLGFVLDFFEIAFILLPLLIIPAQALGIDLVWFGIIVAMNLQTSFLTPPFGFSLFFLRSVVPSKPHQDAATGETIAGVRTGEIYRGVVPFIALQVLTIGLVVMFPQIVSVFSPPTVQLEDAAIEDALRELQSDVEFAPMIPTFD